MKTDDELKALLSERSSIKESITEMINHLKEKYDNNNKEDLSMTSKYSATSRERSKTNFFLENTEFEYNYPISMLNDLKKLAFDYIDYLEVVKKELSHKVYNQEASLEYFKNISKNKLKNIKKTLKKRLKNVKKNVKKV